MDISKLESDQIVAFDAIMAWAKTPEKEFRLWGYAGTGKTFLMQCLAKELASQSNMNVVCCAPTGKAVSVLQKKMPEGIPCSTLHRLIYRPIEPSTIVKEELSRKLEFLKVQNNDEELINETQKKLTEEINRLKQLKLQFTMKDNVEVGFTNIVICDEASMPTDKHRQDLLSTGCKVIWVGDPGQLPPIGGKEWFGIGEPDACLEKIKRQAMDSPIIRLSMGVRSGQVKQSEFQFDDCKISNARDIDDEEYYGADQILCGTNRVRRRFNRKLRKHLGLDSIYPLAKDRLICIRNQNMGKTQFINGVQCVCSVDTNVISDKGVSKYFMEIEYDEENLEVEYHHRHFALNYGDLEEDEEFTFDKRKYYSEFDYAYAVTVHKSQGSEWENVVFYDDNFAAFGKFANKQTRKRFLYTAVTRAKNNLTWVRSK